MPRRLSLRCLIFPFVCFATVNAQVLERTAYSNFSIGFGARALSMGGAFIALADDITAISYNPAGLAQLFKPELSAGISYSISDSHFPGIEDNSSSLYTYYRSDINYGYKIQSLDYIGVVVPFRLAGMPITIGIANQTKDSNKFSPSGYSYSDAYLYNNEDYADEYRYYDTTSGVGGLNITTLSLAVRPFRILYLGMNVNIWKEKRINSGHYDYQWLIYDSGEYVLDEVGSVEFRAEYMMSGEKNYDVGLLLKTRILSLGFIYRTEFKINRIREYHYNSFVSSFGGEVINEERTREYRGYINWPYNYGIGLSLRPLDAVTLSADYTFSKWSEGKYTDEEGNVSGFPNDNSMDSRQFRVGVEYLAAFKKIAIPIRAGWFLDQVFWADANDEPVKNNVFTFGTGVAFKNVVIDAAALYRYAHYWTSWYSYGRSQQSVLRFLLSLSFRI